MHRRRLLPIRQHLCTGGDDAEAGVETALGAAPIAEVAGAHLIQPYGAPSATLARHF